MDQWLHQIMALERRDRWLQAATAARSAHAAQAPGRDRGARTEDQMSEHEGQKPALRERVRERVAEHRAVRADRHARRKRKVGLNPQDAADIAGAAQVRGGFFTTDPGPRP
jgi:hypothetical protein